MEWQTRWRIVILACLLGLVMLFALLGGICSTVGQTPRTTAAATFLLWLLTAALLVVGAGEPLCCVLRLSGPGNLKGLQVGRMLTCGSGICWGCS